MFVLESNANYVIGAARSAAMKTDFFQHLPRVIKSEDPKARFESVKLVGEFLKYGQLVAFLVINSPDMF